MSSGKGVSLQIRYATSPHEAAGLGSDGLRKRFLVDALFSEPGPRLVYTHHDRMVIGGVTPGDSPIMLEAPEELRVDHFLQRRELLVSYAR